MPEKTRDADRPDYKRSELSDVESQLELLEHLLGGTRVMWDNAAKYIRQWKDEKDQVWRIRAKIETVFEGFSRTLDAAVGMLYAKPPALDWNGSSEMETQWDNIDGEGTAGHVFVKRFSDAAGRDGVGLILVDPSPRPRDEDGQPMEVDAATQDALDLRPYWAMYGRQRVLNWRTAKRGGKTVLTQITLHEPAEVADGAFGVTTVDRYRVLRLNEAGKAEWEIFQKIEDGEQKGEFKSVADGSFLNDAGKQADELPISIAYTGRFQGTMQADIPLKGVAWANLAHWRQSSNLTFYRELACFPQPLVKGKLAPDTDAQGNQVPGKLKMGPLVWIQVEESGDFSWVELSGSALDQVEKGVKEKLEQMGQQGISFLTPDKRAAETAEAKRMDATAERSTLSTMAQGIDDAINVALQHHAWFLGIDKDNAPTFEIDRDFEDSVMDAQTMAVYLNAVADAGLPPRIMLEAWQRGGRIPQDADLDELEMELIAGVAAEEERRREEREERMERMGGREMGTAA